MDVPFTSSSAINREHYHLVQSVEAATSLQRVDDILLHKVDYVKKRFLRRTRAPSNSDCISSLVMLLYCRTAATGLHNVITAASLEFALPHALTLAEAGKTIKEKRIGYLFCTEIMNDFHELTLMLVNTLRKDLDSTSPARICLALDTLASRCPADAIPAVTPRLLDLLAHDSPHVKRKALAVVRKAALQEPGLLLQARAKLDNRLRDNDDGVVKAAFRLLEDITRAHIIKPQEAIEILLASPTAHPQTLQSRSLRLPFMEVTGHLISELISTSQYTSQLEKLLDIYVQLIPTAAVSDHALILQLFRALSGIPINELCPRFQSQKLFSLISKLLISRNPNMHYLCMACLEHLPIELWAGVREDIPMALNEGQVNTIMSFLDSQDSSIRHKTLQVLYKVDSNILLMHLTGLISMPATSDEFANARRILEVVEVYEQEAFSYATRLQEVCARLKDRHDKKLVFEDVVEQVLLHLRTRSDPFCGQFADAMIRIPVSDSVPTLTLVMAAAICEYSHLSAIPPVDILSNLSQRLETSPPSIQEALLLTMLRVTARCVSVHSDVSDRVRELHRKSRSHIQRRCMQYITFANQLPLLQNVVDRMKSNTLPDFLLALETVEKQPTVESAKSTSSSQLDVQPPTSPRGKLRYEAYERPRPAAKLSTRRGSSHSLSSQSNRSNSDIPSSPQSYSRGKSIFELEDEAGTQLSRTLTAGDLALAVHDPVFTLSTAPPSPTHSSGRGRPVPISRSQNVADLTSKTDLITLESPFLAEPAPSSSLDALIAGIAMSNNSDIGDFESAWNGLSNGTVSRGWSECTVQELVARFTTSSLPNYQVKSSSPDVLPYPGETKLLLSDLGSTTAISSTDNPVRAAIRIRSGDEGTALWQMRCFDVELKSALLKIFDA